MDKLVTEVLDRIRFVLGTNSAGLHEPEFNGKELEYLRECVETRYVSSVGKFVDEFEVKLANYTGSRFAVATVNGTSALHIALMIAGVQNNDEVLIPALTFIATANAVSYCGAVPHLVDSENQALGIDPEKLRNYLNRESKMSNGYCVNKKTGRIIKAIIPMHVFGLCSRIEELLEIAKDFNIKLIEDAAESLGSYHGSLHTGKFGESGIFSFNGNKIITTGGGGAIITNNKRIAELAKHLTTTAKLKHKWEFEHDVIGYNYRMPNINAALGCAQLENIEYKLGRKRILHLNYVSVFKNNSFVKVINETQNTTSNYWLNILRLQHNYEKLDAILSETNKVGISTRPIWKLVSENKPYTNVPKMDLSTAYELRKSVICVPSSPQLSEGKL